MHIDFARLKLLDARAVEESVRLVAKVTVPDLARPTPCEDWSLGDLLAHMTVQHQGFAAAAQGRGDDLGLWAVVPLGDEAIPGYTDAAAQVTAAFAAVASPDREFTLPEFKPVPVFPASLAIGFHLIDYVVHAWDVASSLGVVFEPDAEVLTAALPIALAVPDGSRRLELGSAFKPGLPVTDTAAAMDRILAVLGRSPDWSAGPAYA